MFYTLGWYDPARDMSFELDYGTLADAQLHFDWLLSCGLTNVYLKCQVLN